MDDGNVAKDIARSSITILSLGFLPDYNCENIAITTQNKLLDCMVY